MRFTTIALVAAFALSATTASASTLITFDGTPDNYDDLQSYDGFNFDFSASGWGVVAGDFSCCTGQNVLNGTNHLMFSGERDGAPSSVTITKIGGGNFSLKSFDVATAFVQSTGLVRVKGFFSGGGSISRVYEIGDSYQSRNARGFTGLTSLVFAETRLTNFTDYGVGLDNILLASDAVIPEPATWAMMIAGFGLVGFAARRRRETAIAA